MRSTFGYARKAVPIFLIAISTHLLDANTKRADAFSTSHYLPRVIPHQLDRSTTIYNNKNSGRSTIRLPSYHHHHHDDAKKIARPQSYRRQRDTRLYSSAAIAASPAAAASLMVGPFPISWLYLSLLAIQFGCQPLLTKKFAPTNIVRSTFVMAQDVVRFISCCILLFLSGSWGCSMQSWTIQGALFGAGIPSVLYLVQNYCALMAYQNLPPVTFNVLNQTKTLSAALCCFLIMGRKQSLMQVVSLVMLLFSALIVEKVVPVTGFLSRKKDKGAATTISKSGSQDDMDVDDDSSSLKKKEKNGDQFYNGVIPVLVASFISGLAGALSQRNLQVLNCNTYIFSMELSVFSITILLISLLLGSPDGKRLRQGDFTAGWTWKTWIPIITNACGGVVVGLVTKHAGAVRKGFALIFGLVLSGVLQSYYSSDDGDDGISIEQIAGGILASISLWMHSKFPAV